MKFNFVDKAIVFISVLLTGFCAVAAESLDGRTIAQMVKDRPDGDTRTSDMEMTLINKGGSSRVRKISSMAMDVGKDTKQIMFFLYPNDVKGTGFLTINYDDMNKDKDKWLYMPSLKKTRRISGKSSKTDYFMGSDFTFDDIGKRNVDEDIHTLLREESKNGHDYWVLESKPKKNDEIYTKKISWIRKDCLIPERVEYYDKLSTLQRVLVNDNIENIGGFWTSTSMNMENVQTKHSTHITFSNQKYDVEIDPKIFTVNRLEKGK